MPTRRLRRRVRMNGTAEPSGKVKSQMNLDLVGSRRLPAVAVLLMVALATPRCAVAQGMVVHTMRATTAGPVDVALPPPFEAPLMGDGPARVLPLLIMGSGLSEEQRVRVQQIVEGQRATLDALFEKLASLNDGLATKLLAASGVAEADLTPLVEQIAETREALIQNGVKVALQVRGVLTPEQLAKAASVQQRLEALEAERRELLGGGDRMLFLAN